MNWKRISIWSGLGGLLFGTAVYAIKKSSPKGPLYAEPIPKGIKKLQIELQPYRLGPEQDASPPMQQCFFCEPTNFYVWSVLPTSRSAGRPGHGQLVSQTRGTQIFFVAPALRSWLGDDRPPGDPELAGEAFYATIRVHTEPPRKPLVSQIAREHPLEFRKCLVGGGPNGIETGEILVTQQAVLDLRFDIEEV
jgi:hypothetical protein